MNKKNDIINVKSTVYVDRSRITNDYLSDINKIPLISKEREKELFIEYKASQRRLNKATKNPNYSLEEMNEIRKREAELQEKIKSEVVAGNQRYLFAMARRYNNNDILLDLVSIGTIGMYEAFDAYEPSSNNRFCTLAGWYVRRAINNYLLRFHNSVRSTNGNKIIPKVKKIENDFFLANGRKPSASEITDILSQEYGVDVSNDSDIYGAKMTSVSAVINNDDESTFEESNEFTSATASENDYETAIEKESLSYALKKALSTLTERERTIICMSVGYGYSKEYKDKEIGEELGLTSERIRQLRMKAQRKMASVFSVASVR